MYIQNKMNTFIYFLIYMDDKKKGNSGFEQTVLICYFVH